VELDPPPQLVKPSVLRPSPAPAASRADLARNWRRVRETSLTDNSPHPFDPQPHPSPTPLNSFSGGHVSLRRSILQVDCSETSTRSQQGCPRRCSARAIGTSSRQRGYNRYSKSQVKRSSLERLRYRARQRLAVERILKFGLSAARAMLVGAKSDRKACQTRGQCALGNYFVPSKK
jgi:hypothetical protein